MSDIIMITLLVVATVAIVLHILSMCKMIKDTDRRNKEKKQNQLKNKVMANAEPECSRCLICGKKFADGGVFKQYKNEWYCINCYLWILNVKNESFIKKVKAHFLEERKKQTESEKAGDK